MHLRDCRWTGEKGRKPELRQQKGAERTGQLRALLSGHEE